MDKILIYVGTDLGKITKLLNLAFFVSINGKFSPQNLIFFFEVHHYRKPKNICYFLLNMGIKNSR